ncbi:MAG: hypothetical protein ACRCXN_13000 [Bacteroidales bacterium]
MANLTALADEQTRRIAKEYGVCNPYEAKRLVDIGIRFGFSCIGSWWSCKFGSNVLVNRNDIHPDFANAHVLVGDGIDISQEGEMFFAALTIDDLLPLLPAKIKARRKGAPILSDVILEFGMYGRGAYYHLPDGATLMAGFPREDSFATGLARLVVKLYENYDFEVIEK